MFVSWRNYNSTKRFYANRFFVTETDYENDWNDDYYEDKPKLPKETRNAMMMMGNSLKSNMICKCCQERVYRAKLLKNNETQTTPTLSRTDIRNSIFKNFNKIPCPKNLLCEQGLHSGKCNVTIRPNLTCNICSSNCPCQQGSIFLSFLFS